MGGPLCVLGELLIPPIRNLKKNFIIFLRNKPKVTKVSDGRRLSMLFLLLPIRVNYLFLLTKYSIPSFKPGWEKGQFLLTCPNPKQVLTFL